MTALSALFWWVAVVDVRRFSTRLTGLFPLGIIQAGAIAVLLDFTIGATAVSLLLGLVVSLSFLFLGAVWFETRAALRRSANHFALVAASAVIGLVISEAVFRLLLTPVMPATEPQFVDQIVRSWPHPVALEKSPRATRILGLADSFGRAGGSQNYHYLLESSLQRTGGDIEVVNISMPGIEPSDELQLLQRFGPQYRPDLVLHGFFVGNDFTVRTGDLMALRGIPIRLEHGLLALRPHNFALYRWPENYLKVLRHMRRAREDARGRQGIGAYTEDEFLDIEWRAMAFYRLDAPAAQEWQRTIADLDQIKAEVERIGARYSLVIHPDVLQMDAQLRRAVAARYRADLRSFDFDLPQKFLKRHCAFRGIPCLDLLPRLRAETAKGRSLYSFRDNHYNAEGNEVVAQSIYEFLRSGR